MNGYLSKLFNGISSFLMVVFGLLAGIFTSVASPATAQSPLCGSVGEDQSYEWISRVSINGNSVNISKAGYVDISGSVIATLVAGESYPVGVDVRTDGTEYSEWVNIWLDMNQDGAIDPVAERIYQENHSFASFYTFSGTITVPDTAYNGQVFGRIIMQYDASPDLCGPYTYGTTVDFRVALSGGTANPDAPLPPDDVIAVAGNGEATVSFSAPATGPTPTEYLIVSEPGNISVTTTSTSATIPGLTNGQSYTFTVYSKGSPPSIVSSGPSEPSNAVTPGAFPDASASSGSVGDGTAGVASTITVSVLDAGGNGVPGVADLLSAQVSGANTAGPLVFTETDPGQYAASYVPTVAGSDSIAIALDGAALANSPLTSVVAPGAPEASASTADATDGTAGVASTVSVELFDAHGNAVPGAAELLSAQVTGANTAGPLVFTETDPGQYAAGYVPTVAGSDSIAITLDGTALSNSPLTSVVAAGTRERLAITQQPLGGPSGEVLLTQPVVEIRDSHGNRVTGDDTTEVTVSLLSGTDGTLGGTVGVTATGGIASFGDLTLAGLVGEDYVLRFAANGLASADSDAVTVAHGAATQLAISTQPEGGASGEELATQPVVEIRDAQGNLVTGDDVTEVTVSIHSGDGGTLGGTQSVAVTGGIANFADLILAGTVGEDYQLRFAATGLTAADSDPVNVTHGAATQLTITTQPEGGASGEALLTQPIVEIRDAQGNLVAGDSTTEVLVSIHVGDGGSLGGRQSMRVTGGIASFSDLSLAGITGEDYVLRFAAGGLTAAESAALRVSHGVATQLVVTTQPEGGRSGGALLTQPVIEIRDAQGNLVAGDAGTQVTVSILSGTGGTLSGTLGVTSSGGIASFGDLTLAGLVGQDYVLRFTGIGLAAADSDAVTVLHGAGVAMVFAIEPGGAASGEPLAPAPVVELRDAEGNLLTEDDSTTITVSLHSGDGGSLGGVQSATVTGGIARFDDLSLTGIVGEDYVLRFIAQPGAIELVSQSLNVRPGAAAASTATISASLTSIAADGLASSDIRVELRDAQGNQLTSGGDIVALEATLGTLGIVVDHGDGSYSATFTSTDREGTAEITGTVNGTPIADAVQVTMYGSVEPHNSEVQASVDTATADNDEAVLITVWLRDSSGNLITAGGANVVLTTNIGTLFYNPSGSSIPARDDGDGTYSAYLRSDVVGLATVTVQVDGKDAGVVQVNFVSPALSAADSSVQATSPVTTDDASLVTIRLVSDTGTAVGGRADDLRISLVPNGTARVSEVVESSEETGTYLAHVTNTVAEDVTVGVTIDDATLIDAPTIRFAAGAVHAGKTSVAASPATGVAADGHTTSVVTVTLRDAGGNPISGIAAEEFLIAIGGSADHAPVTEAEAGIYTFDVTNTVAEDVTVSVSVNGIVLANTPLIGFVPANAAGATSTISASPSEILANGTDTSVITVVLHDTNGNRRTVGGDVVTLTTSLGALTVPVDNGDGSYTSTLHAGTRAGTATISGSVNGVSMTATANVTFLVDALHIGEVFTEVTSAFIHRRMDRILSSEPTLQHLDRRREVAGQPRFSLDLQQSDGRVAASFQLAGTMGERPGGGFDATNTDGSPSTMLQFSGQGASADQRWYFWTQGQLQTYSDRTGTLNPRDGRFGIVQAGVDHLFHERMAVGLMAHLDLGSERIDSFSRVSGTGWMIGPYVSAELAPELFFTGRVAWGLSSNTAAIDVYQDGYTWSGDFRTERLLARAGVYGRYEHGRATFRPQVDLAWMRERQQDYTVTDDSSQVGVQGITATMGRLSLSGTAEWPAGEGQMQPILFVSPRLDWDFHHSGTDKRSERLRGTLELGVSTAPASDWRGELSLRYDGIGQRNFDAWGIRFGMSRQF